MGKENIRFRLSEEDEVNILREGLAAARSSLDEHEDWKSSRVILRAMAAADRVIKSEFREARGQNLSAGNMLCGIYPDIAHLIATALWSKSLDIPIEECHPYAEATSWAEPLSAAIVAAENIGNASYAIDPSRAGLSGVVNFDVVDSLLES